MGTWFARISFTLMAVAGAACGAAAQSAATPEAVTSPEPAPPEPTAEMGSARRPTASQGEGGASFDDDSAAVADESAAVTDEPSAGDSEPEVSAEPPEPPAPAPLPSEVVAADGIAFLLDDPGSELKDKLTAQCEAKIPDDDPAKLAECRSKARDEFRADVFVFAPLPGGKFKWTIYQRSRSVLKEVYSAQVKMVDERQNGFKLRPLSGQGARPVFKGRGDVPFSMPSKNELVLEDPTYGKLVYRAKFGLVGN